MPQTIRRVAAIVMGTALLCLSFVWFAWSKHQLDNELCAARIRFEKILRDMDAKNWIQHGRSEQDRINLARRLDAIEARLWELESDHP
jgi:hypothetical protein